MPSFVFKNANVVLDEHAELQPGFNILVKGDRIEAVTRDPIDLPDAQQIDVAGKTVMPGLIDAHAHITGLSLSPKNLTYPAADLVVASANYLRNSLMAGFTAIREAGGADYSIAHLLKEGTIIGPDKGVRIGWCGISSRRPSDTVRILGCRTRSHCRGSQSSRHLCHGACIHR